MAWLSGWSYRKSQVITGTVVGAQTDYQIEKILDIFSALPVNAGAPQVTPTSDATGQAIHPSILYFPDGWNGYDYWMAMTPYPNGNDDFETPEILACDDGVNWVVPAGGANPIVSRDAAAPNTDVHLFYNVATDELWVYYRKTDGASYERIYLKKSSDGVNWGGVGLGTLVISATWGVDNVLSPSVVKIGATYYMLTVDAFSTPNVIQYRTSADGTAWSASTNCVLNEYQYMISGKEAWHQEIRYMTAYSEYWMLLTVCDTGSTGANCSLVFAKSRDAINWYLYPFALLTPSAAGWDNNSIYKSTLILDGTTLKIWYSARSAGGVWRTGYTTATLESIVDFVDMFTKMLIDGGDIRFTTNDGITEFDYWMSHFTFGGYASIWFEVPNIPASPDSVIIYMYYGKAGEATTSSILNTMIRGDDGVVGNFDEDARGTAVFSYVDGKYKITEDSIDDAFASGNIWDSWAKQSAIEVFDELIGTSGASVTLGLFDEDVVAELCGAIAASSPKRRFVISRYGSLDPFAQQFVIAYWNGAGTQFTWTGVAWGGGVTRHVAAGTVMLKIWSDGVNILADILSDGVSIFAATPSIAIATVKAFGEDVCCAWSEHYTDFGYVTQEIDNYYERKYAEPEPILGAWGAEESPSVTVADIGVFSFPGLRRRRRHFTASLPIVVTIRQRYNAIFPVEAHIRIPFQASVSMDRNVRKQFTESFVAKRPIVTQEFSAD